MPADTPFSIGQVIIDPPLVQAPMAGVTHSPLRQTIASFGRPGLFFSEMLSARHLPHDLRKNSLWIKRTEIERPMAYQIFAADAEEAVQGCRELLETDAEIIDLNLACPAPNIAGKRKAGAHLLSDLGTVATMLAGLRQEVSDRPLTVKIRLGKKPDLVFLKELAALLEENRIDAVTLHPRLVSEKLRRRARWEYIGHLKDMSNLTVIGNGDVKSSADCHKMFAQTGCDGVMIGRAAISKPWIFAEISNNQPMDLTPEFLFNTYSHAIDLITNFFPMEGMAMGRIKEFTWYFSKNLKFGHRFAARMQPINSLQACQQYIKENFLKAVEL